MMEPRRRSTDDETPGLESPPDDEPDIPERTRRVVYRDARSEVFITEGAVTGRRYRFVRLVPQEVNAADADEMLQRTRTVRPCCGAQPQEVNVFASADN